MRGVSRSFSLIDTRGRGCQVAQPPVGEWTNVTVEMTCGILAHCLTEGLRVSGGPGDVSDSGAWVGIHDIGRGIAGRYNFSASFAGNRHCSGSFSLSGTKRNYAIRVYDSCSDAGSGEF